MSNSRAKGKSPAHRGILCTHSNRGYIYVKKCKSVLKYIKINIQALNMCGMYSLNKWVR